MENLISMTDYVLEQSKQNPLDLIDFKNNVINYAKFLSMPLELKMFAPFDEYGSVIKEPTVDAYMQPKEVDRQFEAYKQALSEVLFEGFEKLKDVSFAFGSIENRKIEDLVNYNLKLTPNAKLKYKF